MMGNFLEKPPGVDVTEDTIFATQNNVETFIMGIYKDGMYTDMPEWNDRNGKRDAAFGCYCDEAENVASWYSSQRYNTASITPQNNGDAGRWTYRWKAIRSINTLLDRIDDVPDASDEYKKQAKGQALFIRGLCYFEMFKRYGGVPIVDKRFSFDDPESLKIGRATLEETVDFIVKDAVEAAKLLPDKWPLNHTGKATKGAALMLKSRTLLYAASDLSNTATPPLALQGHNELISYGNYDVNRWKLAADAAKEVIDWAPNGEVRLIDDRGEDKNYQYVWSVADNEEVIMSSKLTGSVGFGTNVFKSLNNFYFTQSGTMITQNFVEKYEKKDGTPQYWDPNGGNNLAQIYKDLDPRFGQSIGYNGAYWNKDFPVLTLWEGAVPSNQPPLLDLKTGYWVRKYVPEELNLSTNAFAIWTLYRLAEAYLNYAEALNEFHGRPVKEAYDAVNLIRGRSGMPDFPSDLSQEEFREKIRNERSIELFFEEHRLWDVMRWRIAEEDGVMQGGMKGIKIYKLPDPSSEFRWEPYVFEERFWKASMYRIPFPQSEVDKGYIIQNSGW
ncbi:RagB/SusD family nutrient uptake outer membrane protein [Proteiniphilum sp. UBA5384]|uniref:RagB/SusD family nutrient uptake outer membrane protein n=1 Tax=Proteiniphilum sp. UBA5384 TaxID=1947279 RepID=UPI0025CF9936|nr:RagB/SusD family nutrient uptake outer membrane protein [Proteiniphilum sp. UBA5384]